MELFRADGHVKFLGERLKECSQAYQTAIVEGVQRVTNFHGYAYQDLYKHSFTDVREAYGLKMNGADFVEWAPHEIRSLDQPYVLFVLELAMGNGRAYPQPTGRFDLLLEGRLLLSFTLVKYNRLWEKDDVRFYFQVKRKMAGGLGQGYTLDEWIQADNPVVSGIGYLRVPAALLGGNRKPRFRIEPVCREKSENWVRLGVCRSVLLCDIYDGLKTVHDGPCPVSMASGLNAYFGDIHAHSADGEFLGVEGCGTGTWQENFDYARDVAGLDFFCMTDHDWQLGREDWQRLREITDAYNQAGRFAALKGYEWTSTRYGHRNVYFREGDVDEVFDFRAEKISSRFGFQGTSQDDPTPADLWKWLDDNRLEAITVPHHSNADQFLMDFSSFFNERYDRLVEVYSCWGSSLDVSHPANMNNDKFPALAVGNYLDRLRFGFIASSDGHDGNPGNGSYSRGHRYFLGHHLGSGRAAVLAESLSRESVYDALKARRCYATTGAPIGFFFRVNGRIMGDELPAPLAQSPKIEVKVQAPDRIARLEIFKNRRRLHRLEGVESPSLDVELDDPAFQPGQGGHYRATVILEDGETAWSSPVFVPGPDKGAGQE